MVEEKIDMSNEYNKFCVSWVATQVSQIGIKRFINSWNHHRIPGKNLIFIRSFLIYIIFTYTSHMFYFIALGLGKGIPLKIKDTCNEAHPIDPNALLSTEDAYRHYTTFKGKLTRVSRFGEDPLEGNPTYQKLRDENFLKFFDFNDIFTDVLQQGSKLQEAIVYLIELTNYYLNMRDV